MPNGLKTITLTSGFHTNAYQAIVSVDVDPAANRVIIFNRDTLEYYANKRTDTPIVNLRVPNEFVINNKLIVGILDEDGVYDCKMVDGKNAELLKPIMPVIRS
ncbi:hypothetical protein N7V09_12515 [Shewanella seohaensis]|uniref:hypothetical protein n=1 Tax=Shewanella seohaensis TaxID=755175 RepID=UPI00200EBB36|nr:hypothetical protein [Shewanella seohaensis]MCL1121176.1 hypothetical protein [Shewanella seohaensis]UXM80720.1 hypothetical protein N7V09_12515 [Shewanella seohaensis]